MRADAYPVTATRSIFDGRVVHLRVDTVQMSDGRSADREVVAHPGAVGILALDEHENVVLVNQYRHPVGRRLDELPAGLLDVPGESALAAARRELAEEAGLVADQWQVLLDLYPTPGISSEAIRLFLARRLSAVSEADRFVAEGEELTLTVERVSIEAAIARIQAGSLTNAAAVAGIFAVQHARANGWDGLRAAETPWFARPTD